MLVLTRLEGEDIIIDDDTVVRVLKIDGGIVRFGIQAPREVIVLREELVGRPELARKKTRTVGRKTYAIEKPLYWWENGVLFTGIFAGHAPNKREPLARVTSVRQARRNTSKNLAVEWLPCQSGNHVNTVPVSKLFDTEEQALANDPWRRRHDD